MENSGGIYSRNSHAGFSEILCVLFQGYIIWYKYSSTLHYPEMLLFDEASV